MRNITHGFSCRLISPCGTDKFTAKIPDGKLNPYAIIFFPHAKQPILVFNPSLFQTLFCNTIPRFTEIMYTSYIVSPLPQVTGTL